METVTGIFETSEAARLAAKELSHLGFFNDRVNLLMPGASEQQVTNLPTSETEKPGVGEAIGGVVGAAVGIAGGFDLGAAVASSVVPGVGPVIAVGIAAAALLGIGGAMGGARIGSATDENAAPGIPADEVAFYRDALKRGQSLVVVLANGRTEAARAREVLELAGASRIERPSHVA
ncbi:MAG TPA: hypothetical protein VG672_24315 [Bryobacteraceae bacterium]|jgi:hypothetical protein|nr:hypothetical protein [Bryobacteraceae bacterium]